MDADWRCPRTSSYLLPVRVRRASARLGLAAMLVAGCSSDPGRPRTLPSLTPTPTASATSSATDLEAATTVVREYYSLLNDATTGANADALSKLMTPTCKCQDVARSTREVASKHERYFGKTTLRNLRATSDGSTLIEVLVNYDYERSGIADAQGRAIKSFPARHGASADFSVVKSANRWLISAIVYVSKGEPS